MKSKVVIITGANSGMGFETAQLLSEQGYTVYAGYRSDHGLETLQSLKQPRIIPLFVDVTDSASIAEACEKVFQQELQIDVLINNAGYGYVSANEFADDQSIQHQFDVNVFGVFRMCREVVPYMRKKHSGHIINVSSFLGNMGLPLLSHYVASKYAVEGITDSLRYELAPFNIKVNTVAPGLFKTGFVDHGLKSNDLTTLRSSPYLETADSLLPTVVERINNGIDPKLVAQAIYECLENSSEKRTDVGNEGAYFQELAKSTDALSFEKAVVEALALPESASPVS